MIKNLLFVVELGYILYSAS